MRDLEEFDTDRQPINIEQKYSLEYLNGMKNQFTEARRELAVIAVIAERMKTFNSDNPNG